MASKRKRKLEIKAAQAEDSKMVARREAFNDNLWKFGLPIRFRSYEARWDFHCWNSPNRNI